VTYGDAVAAAGSSAVTATTTSIWTPPWLAADFTERFAPVQPDYLPRLEALVDEFVLDSGFANIPYPCAHQLASLDGRGFGGRGAGQGALAQRRPLGLSNERETEARGPAKV
jgi:hypothetical protein